MFSDWLKRVDLLSHPLMFSSRAPRSDVAQTLYGARHSLQGVRLVQVERCPVRGLAVGSTACRTPTRNDAVGSSGWTVSAGHSQTGGRTSSYRLISRATATCIVRPVVSADQREFFLQSRPLHGSCQFRVWELHSHEFSCKNNTDVDDYISTGRLPSTRGLFAFAAFTLHNHLLTDSLNPSVSCACSQKVRPVMSIACRMCTSAHRRNRRLFAPTISACDRMSARSALWIPAASAMVARRRSVRFCSRVCATFSPLAPLLAPLLAPTGTCPRGLQAHA
jgi:hypothetical protein